MRENDAVWGFVAGFLAAVALVAATHAAWTPTDAEMMELRAQICAGR